MKIFLVGGAVRDELMGLNITDRDFVVTGSTVNEMLALGFSQVGKDFPVFLHPQTNEEYALARKERKTAPGHDGFHFDFSPKTTLEDDLIRRDLTINAIAKDEHGHYIDPYGGRMDIQKSAYVTYHRHFARTRFGYYVYADFKPNSLTLLLQMIL